VEGLARKHGPDPRGWGGILLAESRWELDGPGELADDGEVGGEFLLRLGERYVVYETNGVEWDWSELSSPDDAAAIRVFTEYTGGG
jgi:hypothetical protein